MAALADTSAQARPGRIAAVQSAPPASPVVSLGPGERADEASWIPVLGRSAAGLPHFWASDGDAAGVTMLQELVERHAGRADRQVSSATVAADDKAGEDAVALITLRQGKQGQGVEFVSAGGIKTRYPDAFALRIDGESMAPDIRHGDIVIVSPSVPAANGKAAVVQLHRQIGVTCKLYRRSGKVVHLIPLNERFRPQTYPAEQVEWALRVLARVRGLPSAAGDPGGPSR
jgi:SOS-response transcriptional repressor LexA